MHPFLFQINKKPKSKGKPGLPKIPTQNAQVIRNGVLGDYNNFRDSKKNNQNIHFFMTPVDKNIECFDVFKLNPYNDVFYAMSHGVNRATLKEGKTDDRVNFLNKLIFIN